MCIRDRATLIEGEIEVKGNKEEGQIILTPGPDGYCGDEDNGQTSAWYVFSALGLSLIHICPMEYTGLPGHT